jgi:hypothetical protein
MRNAIFEGLNLIAGHLNDDDRIKTLFSANEDEIDFNKKDLYPMANIRVSANDFNTNQITYEVTVLDIRDNNKKQITNKFKGNDNRWDNWTLTYDVLRELIAKIERLQNANNIEYISSSGAFQIDNAFANGLDGFSVLITLTFNNKSC